MCGAKARTNFPHNPINEADQSSSSKLLSATLTAKLQHKCHMASMAKHKPAQITEPMKLGVQGISNPSGNAAAVAAGTSTDSNNTGFRWLEGKVEVAEQQQFHPVLEDDHIEQMIQELLHYGSIELSS